MRNKTFLKFSFFFWKELKHQEFPSPCSDHCVVVYSVQTAAAFGLPKKYRLQTPGAQGRRKGVWEGAGRWPIAPASPMAQGLTAERRGRNEVPPSRPANPGDISRLFLLKPGSSRP